MCFRTDSAVFNRIYDPGEHRVKHCWSESQAGFSRKAGISKDGVRSRMVTLGAFYPNVFSKVETLTVCPMYAFSTPLEERELNASKIYLFTFPSYC